MTSKIPHVSFGPDGDALEPLLSGLAAVFARYPIATQAAFRALTCEGRQFAQTAEGAALREQLARSPLLARIGTTWEVLGMGAFVEGEEQILPSVYLDGLVRLAAEEELHAVLSRVFEPKG